MVSHNSYLLSSPKSKKHSILLAHFGLDTVVKHDFHNFYLTYVYPVPIFKNYGECIDNHRKLYERVLKYKTHMII